KKRPQGVLSLRPLLNIEAEASIRLAGAQPFLACPQTSARTLREVALATAVFEKFNLPQAFLCCRFALVRPAHVFALLGHHLVAFFDFLNHGWPPGLIFGA